MDGHGARRPLRVVVLSWRDRTHPEGGGAEAYAEHVAAGLAERGHEVEIWCARHATSGAVSHRDGVVLRHAGGRATVYPRALLRLARRRLAGTGPDVVVDVHNGVPFFARLVGRSPVVVLVHHVHREQWPLVFGRVTAWAGWFLESRVSPLVHRRCRYVAVSDVTRRELVDLGVGADRIQVVHNGSARFPAPTGSRDPDPHLVVLGRLVPHKRVEHAVRVLHRLRLEGVPATLTVMGDGWWADKVRTEVERCGVADHVRLLGHVDEVTKHAVLGRAWVMLAPSVKEGWGLMAVEAAQHATPTVAYASSGGLTESVVDGRTGLLVDDEQGLLDATRRLLQEESLRLRLGAAARDHAARYTWEAATDEVEDLLLEVVRDERVSARRTAPAAR